MQKTEAKKSVIVIDEQGKIYETTYPKRAKGLVKSGRARFVDENKICLTCPPKINVLEENKMDNNENTKIDLNYIMSKIDEIIEMNRAALDKNYEFIPGAPGVLHPVQAICETNNRMIAFLEKIYQSMQVQDSSSNYKTKKIMELIEDSYNKGDVAMVDTLLCSLHKF